MSWNTSNPAIKRLMKEIQSLESSPSPNFVAYPMEDNIFQWHFTMTGPPDTPYTEGLYHGKILLPPNYPFAPPDVVLLTPNGRFELNKKICVSITSFHPENWNPTFNIAMVLSALREFMSTPGNSAIGAIEYAEDVRRRMAAESTSFVCPHCQQTNAAHRAAMNAVPSDSVFASRVDLTPVMTPSSPTAPFTPPPPLPPIDSSPPPAPLPAAATEREVAEAEDADDPEDENADDPAVAMLPPIQPHHGIVVQVRTLDNAIGVVFFAILIILVKKYLAGNLGDVMKFNV